jgi:hypothetical protein
MEITNRTQARAALDTLMPHVAAAHGSFSRLPAEQQATLRAALTWALQNTRELMPAHVVEACKRHGLPYQNGQFVDELFAVVLHGPQAISYVVQRMRENGWTVPARWDEQVALFERHGFTVAKHATRKYCYTVGV